MAKREVVTVEERAALRQKAVRRLRVAGKVPAVLYGDRKAVVPLSLEAGDVQRIQRSGARMIDLKRGGTVEPALIKEIQFDPFGERILHLDFQRVALDRKITLRVPFEFAGTPKGLAEGGVVETLMADVEVECLPTEIPERVTVSVAGLKLGEAVHLRDVQFPAGVKPVGDPEALVIAVTFKEAEEEAPAAPEEEMKEPEVIREVKKEEEPEEVPEKKK